MERLELEEDLRHAAARGQLSVRYGPLLDLGSGSRTAVEAALEWRHPRRGSLGYAEFAEVAEESGVAVELTTWLLQQACREAATSPKRTVHVPLPARSLEEPAVLVESVRTALAESALPPSRLTLAVPESALSLDLSGLAELGITVAVEALGSGTSSLERLASAPIHALKLSADASPALVRATQAIATALDLTIVAPASPSEVRAAA
jgi:EAL domain-containing protein (putative c-di-GMP-specific phosphodiesterase class I)